MTDGVALKLHEVDRVEDAALVPLAVVDTDGVIVIDVGLDGDAEIDPVALLVTAIERVLDAHDEGVTETEGEPLVANDAEDAAEVDAAAEDDGDTDALRDALGDGDGERLTFAEAVTRITELEAAAETLALGLGLLDEEIVFETIGVRELDGEPDGDGDSVADGDSDGDPELTRDREANDALAQADTETLDDARADALDERDADSEPEAVCVTEPLNEADRDVRTDAVTLADGVVERDRVGECDVVKLELVVLDRIGVRDGSFEKDGDGETEALGETDVETRIERDGDALAEMEMEDDGLLLGDRV